MGSQSKNKDLKILVKYYGYIFGDILESNDNGIKLKNVEFASDSQQIEEMAINFSDILKCQKIGQIDFSEFRDEELIDLANVSDIPYRKNAVDELQKRNIADPLQQKKCTGLDQLQSNKKLLGIPTGFDLNEYTIPIDETAPDYKQKLRESKKIAEEILKEQTVDEHRREERGLEQFTQKSEEEKYSMVSDVNIWAKKEEKKEEAMKDSSAKETNKRQKRPRSNSPIEIEALESKPEEEKPNASREQQLPTSFTWEHVGQILMERKEKIKETNRPSLASDKIKLPQRKQKEKAYLEKQASKETQIEEKPQKDINDQLQLQNLRITFKNETKNNPEEILKRTRENFANKLVLGYKIWGEANEMPTITYRFKRERNFLKKDGAAGKFNRVHRPNEEKNLKRDY